MFAAHHRKHTKRSTRFFSPNRMNTVYCSPTGKMIPRDRACARGKTSRIAGVVKRGGSELCRPPVHAGASSVLKHTEGFNSRLLLVLVHFRLKTSLHAASREISVGSLAPLPRGSRSARLLIDNCQKTRQAKNTKQGEQQTRTAVQVRA